MNTSKLDKLLSKEERNHTQIQAIPFVLDSAPELATTGALQLCPRAAAEGKFKLRLAMQQGLPGQALQTRQSLAVLERIFRPLTGPSRCIEIDEYSFGQYAQFTLEVDVQRGIFQVTKKMNGQQWVLHKAPTLQAVLEYIQQHIYAYSSEDGGPSTR